MKMVNFLVWRISSTELPMTSLYTTEDLPSVYVPSERRLNFVHDHPNDFCLADKFLYDGVESNIEPQTCESSHQHNSKKPIFGQEESHNIGSKNVYREQMAPSIDISKEKMCYQDDRQRAVMGEDTLKTHVSYPLQRSGVAAEPSVGKPYFPWISYQTSLPHKKQPDLPFKDISMRCLPQESSSKLHPTEKILSEKEVRASSDDAVELISHEGDQYNWLQILLDPDEFLKICKGPEYFPTHPQDLTYFPNLESGIYTDSCILSESSSHFKMNNDRGKRSLLSRENDQFGSGIDHRGVRALIPTILRCEDVKSDNMTKFTRKNLHNNGKNSNDRRREATNIRNFLKMEGDLAILRTQGLSQDIAILIKDVKDQISGIPFMKAGKRRTPKQSLEGSRHTFIKVFLGALRVLCREQGLARSDTDKVIKKGWEFMKENIKKWASTSVNDSKFHLHQKKPHSYSWSNFSTEDIILYLMNLDTMSRYSFDSVFQLLRKFSDWTGDTEKIPRMCDDNITLFEKSYMAAYSEREMFDDWMNPPVIRTSGTSTPKARIVEIFQRKCEGDKLDSRLDTLGLYKLKGKQFLLENSEFSGKMRSYLQSLEGFLREGYGIVNNNHISVVDGEQIPQLNDEKLRFNCRKPQLKGISLALSRAISAAETHIAPPFFGMVKVFLKMTD